jgi:formate dehydrogenase subunit gamma
MSIRAALGSLLVTMLLLTAPAVTAPAVAQEQGQVPGGSLGGASDADLWRAIRQGDRGTVSIPNERAGVLIQSEGDNWRAIRNGPLSTYGVWTLLGTIALLALFFVVRGRIRVEAGLSGHRIQRFNGFERFAHWLTASTFVVLALTGLNMLYGRYTLLPLFGPEVFATLTLWGKYAHNYLSLGFMIGLALLFVMWVWLNIPNHYDLIWLLKGGGILKRGVHPPSKKFNAGQKIIFWLVILGGASLSLSGVMLLFPFQLSMFGDTFAWINWAFGTDYPTQLTVMQEMQLAQLWHAIVALALTAVILAHIYIGSIGMEGAFDAMGTGQVDENWAREHHNLWVERLERRRPQEGDD